MRFTQLFSLFRSFSSPFFASLFLADSPHLLVPLSPDSGVLDWGLSNILSPSLRPELFTSILPLRCKPAPSRDCWLKFVIRSPRPSHAEGRLQVVIKSLSAQVLASDTVPRNAPLSLTDVLRRLSQNALSQFTGQMEEPTLWKGFANRITQSCSFFPMTPQPKHHLPGRLLLLSRTNNQLLFAKSSHTTLVYVLVSFDFPVV